MPNEPTPEKTLTQTEVNQLMEERLQKERSRFEAQLREHKAARDQAEALLREREAELKQRDEQLRAHALRHRALKQLEARNLPSSLLDALQLTDEASLSASLKTVERAFRASLEDTVRDRLRGHAPSCMPSAPAGVLAKPHLNYLEAAALYQRDRAAYDKQYGGK